ncbi:uncharacterized protein LOC116620022 [Nematostella vectensis]|uniref:uncharacterized protein LOC116620022 n=1 Tax=Nematostella vectensis TaxID=45351 RepID=UPI00138FAA32|nr:uncharacterized protein LOC116620022 [Nematostella vectensis]
MRALIKHIAIIGTLLILAGLADCLYCHQETDCFGVYPHCCDGHCKKTCNTSCTTSNDCGSPNSLQEKCCNGKCVSINTICPNTTTSSTQLSPAIIAVLVVCIVVFAALGSVALVSYLCKCGFYSRRSRSMSVFTPCQGGNKRDSGTASCVVAVKVTKAGEQEKAPKTHIYAETSWVGKDFIQSKGAYTNISKTVENED